MSLLGDTTQFFLQLIVTSRQLVTSLPPCRWFPLALPSAPVARFFLIKRKLFTCPVSGSCWFLAFGEVSGNPNLVLSPFTVAAQSQRRICSSALVSPPPIFHHFDYPTNRVDHLSKRDNLHMKNGRKTQMNYPDENRVGIHFQASTYFQRSSTPTDSQGCQQDKELGTDWP